MMSRRKIFSRRTNPRGFRLPLGLIFVAVLIVLCLLIPSTPLNLANQPITEKAMPTALATLTKPPPPTKEHIGRIIFTCSRGDYNQLCMINADGTGYQQLSSLEANSYYPVFSPLGGSIVYASNQNGGVFDLFLYIFEGSALTPAHRPNWECDLSYLFARWEHDPVCQPRRRRSHLPVDG